MLSALPTNLTQESYVARVVKRRLHTYLYTKKSAPSTLLSILKRKIFGAVEGRVGVR